MADEPIDVCDHLGLARKAAGLYHTPNLDRDDLAQEAVLGLMTAADRFDPSRGCQFSTFAFPWCRQRAREAAARASLVRRPNCFDRTAKGWPQDRKGRPYEPADDAPGPDALAALEDERGRVRAALDRLPERMRRVLHFRFYEGLTLAEVGAVLGMSRQAVQQTEARALGKLRQILTEPAPGATP